MSYAGFAGLSVSRRKLDVKPKRTGSLVIPKNLSNHLHEPLREHPLSTSQSRIYTQAQLTMNTLSLSLISPAKTTMTSHPARFFASIHRNTIDSVSIARSRTTVSSSPLAANLTHVMNSEFRTDY